MEFYAFEEEKPGTIPIAVGHAKYSEGLKYRVSENFISVGDKGWIHDLVFYAYPADTSCLMPIGIKFPWHFSWFKIASRCHQIKEFGKFA